VRRFSAAFKPFVPHAEPASAGGTKAFFDFFRNLSSRAESAALFYLSSRGGLQADVGSAV